MRRPDRRALEPLAANRRVVVRGGAGTGKTRLATAWARQAWADGERVLLTCFNDPLAEAICGRAARTTSRCVTGAFLRLALELPGMPPLAVPPDADATLVGHHHHRATSSPLAAAHRSAFDTIVVDEAQDFSPAWLAQLDSLLDPEGRRRMLMVADEAQGSTSAASASRPRRRLGAGRAGLQLPQRPAHRPHPASQARRGAVAGDVTRGGRRALGAADDLEAAVDRRSTPSSSAWRTRAAIAGDLRGHLPHGRARPPAAEALDLPRWEHRERGAMCENVHRLKGLEFDTVILADTDDVDRPALRRRQPRRQRAHRRRPRAPGRPPPPGRHALSLAVAAAPGQERAVDGSGR